MSPDTVFQIANTLVLPHWLLLLAAPRWQGTKWLGRTLIIPAFLAILYIYYLFAPGSTINLQSFSTLANVKSLFRQDGAMLAGWIHYLAFDLTIGSWISQSSQRRKIPHGWVIPCLILSFLLGPAGLLLYLIIRSFIGQKTKPAS